MSFITKAIHQCHFESKHQNERWTPIIVKFHVFALSVLQTSEIMVYALPSLIYVHVDACEMQAKPYCHNYSTCILLSRNY